MNDRTKKRARFLIDAAYIAVIIVIVYAALKYVVKWILPLVLAFCLSSAIRPLITRAVRALGIKREVVAVIVMALLYVIFGTLLFFLLMQAAFAVRDGFALIPDYYANSIGPTLDSLSREFGHFVSGLSEPWQQQAESMQVDVVSAIQTMLIEASQRGISALSSLTGRVPSFMLALVFTVMLSFFISLQYDDITKFANRQMPPRVQHIVRDTRLIVADTVLKYLRAALTLMFITFCELSAGLLVLGRKNAIAIAAGIAVFDALPFFGSGAILIPWTLIELLQGNYTLAAGLIILYALVAFIRSIIEPKIIGDKLGLNPVVSLTAIYLGFKLFGVLGMILMPITTQILLSLHKKGSIKVFRETGSLDFSDDARG